MKTLILGIILGLTGTVVFSQTTVPVTIQLKSGEKIDVSHFGQLNCSSAEYFSSFIMLRGKFANDYTELKDFSQIASLTLEGFSKGPVASVGNEKGKITVQRKNGVTVALEEAELVLSCYGGSERYNQLRVQVIHPLTDKKFEQVIDMKDIAVITFK